MNRSYESYRENTGKYIDVGTLSLKKLPSKVFLLKFEEKDSYTHYAYKVNEIFYTKAQLIKLANSTKIYEEVRSFVAERLKNGGDL